MPGLGRDWADLCKLCFGMVFDTFQLFEIGLKPCLLQADRMTES